jgi:NADPH2:quinone reductase
MGISRDGSLAERVVAQDVGCVPLPARTDPAVAASLGIAGGAGFLGVVWRGRMRPGERVLVLGATGATGLVALQAARMLKPRQLVAVGRDPERLRRAKILGADETVRIEAGNNLRDALRRAFGGRGPELVIDLLWDEPARAAIEVAASYARIVQVGQAAGPNPPLTGGLLRGKAIDLLGFSLMLVPATLRQETLLRLVQYVGSGEIRLPARRFSLDEIGEAWQLQAEGVGGKVIVCP